MKKRDTIALIAVLVMLAIGIATMVYSYLNVEMPYTVQEDVLALYEDPTSYDTSNPNGVAEIIVKTDLEQTKAANVVAAIVFDYRGFDTIGESFILLASIAGAFVILHTPHKKEEEANEK